jgi:glutathione synthase/RimK-type ligase-like ATP-grasp enzyme
MKFTILYSGRSSKTGRDLLNKFKPLSRKAFRKRTEKRFNTDVILRWGSTETFNKLRGRLELNTLEAVRNASNKLIMMQKLVEANIPTAEILFNPYNQSQDVIDNYRDDNGGFFIRGSNDSIRYDDSINPNDKYISKPIVNKRREYRVHVFNGEVIAIYEKIPNDENVKLFKSYNCHFELKNIENCRLTEQDKQVCIDAVNKLGLLFGGVDLMRDKNKKVFVSEVNSAPALNGTNIDRYVTKINEYIQAMGV